MTDHFTPLALRVRGNNVKIPLKNMLKNNIKYVKITLKIC